MLVNIQLPQVAELLLQLFHKLERGDQAMYAKRVDAARALLCHPCLGAHGFCTINEPFAECADSVESGIV